MIDTVPEEVKRLLHQLVKEPLVSPFIHNRKSVLDQKAVEAILPHRNPFRFIDRVTVLDVEASIITAHYNLAQAESVFAGHFPNRPVWPGVLQVEAIGQAGTILYLRRRGAATPATVTLTHIVGARFIRPIVPEGDVQILARVLEDGLFFMVIGQCLHRGDICSVAAIRGLANDFYFR